MKKYNRALLLGIVCLSLVFFSFVPTEGKDPSKPASNSATKATSKKKASATKKKASSSSKKPKEVDVTEMARKINSKEYASPPTKFRKGHVTSRKLNPKAIKKTKNGFTIQLPSKAPIPTPAVYKGKLYVSGGFHSKEFYCFKADTGKLVWAFNLDDDGPSAAACEDGVVVYNTESCTIFAHDAETGKLLWSHWLGDPLMSTPTIANGRVFTSYPAAGRSASGQLNKGPAQQIQKIQKAAPKIQQKAQKIKAGKKAVPTSHALACFDLKTGKILWQKWIDSDVMSSPVAVGKELHVAAFSGTLYKFNQADGRILSAKRSRATSAPVVVGKDVFFTQRVDQGKEAVAEAVVSNDRVTGKGNFQVARVNAVYLDSKVQIASTFAFKGAALDAGNALGGAALVVANAQVAFDNIGQGNVSTLQAYQGARISNWGRYNLNCPGDKILCTDAQTGKTLWSVKLKGDLKKVGGLLAAPPAIAGGQIFVSTLKGEILQLDPEKGKVMQTYKIGSPIRFQPAVQDGRIFIGTQDGKVVCIDTGNRKYTGWSMWGGNAAHTGAVDRLAKK